MRDAEIKKIVEALEGRVNVIYRRSMKDALTHKELGEIGVARISMGPGIWREGMAAMGKEIERILEGVE